MKKACLLSVLGMFAAAEVQAVPNRIYVGADYIVHQNSTDRNGPTFRSINPNINFPTEYPEDFSLPSVTIGYNFSENFGIEAFYQSSSSEDDRYFGVWNSLDTLSAETDFQAQIDRLNDGLKSKGIVLMVLKKEGNRALVYVCRKSYLQEDLNRPGVASFMKKYGYESTDADKAIETLAKRLKNIDDFPHEIGLFLGYPLGDVIGFIANAGKNSKCSGCWKVYCNECQAIKKFAQFEKCRRVYKEMWQKGKCVSQLAVAV